MAVLSASRNGLIQGLALLCVPMLVGALRDLDAGPISLQGRQSVVLRQQDVKDITPYDILKANGMPTGLLPRIVKDFTIDDKGNFLVNLNYTCCAIADIWGGLPLRYDTTLKGNIYGGRITNLEGVIAEATAHLIWLNVNTIAIDTGNALSFMVTFGRLKFYTDIPTSVFASDLDCKPCS